MHSFDRCVGVELLESLFMKSLELKSLYESSQTSQLGEGTVNKPKFEIVHGDLLEYDWWNTADLVLANSTCFEYTLMRLIAEKADRMKKGSWMITLTKKLPTADPIYERDPSKRTWECVLSLKMVMSWGYATVNIQRKIV